MNVPNVKGIHDLHVWSVTSDEHMLGGHLAISEEGSHDEVLKQSQSILHDEFGIDHATIQVEKEEHGCPNPHGGCN